VHATRIVRNSIAVLSGIAQPPSRSASAGRSNDGGNAIHGNSRFDTDDDATPLVRATRFPLHLSLRYRGAGVAQWREATTENISRTGVLFRTSRPPSIAERIEMQIDLRGPSFGATVRCHGVVKRIAAVDGPMSAAPVAVAMSSHRIIRLPGGTTPGRRRRTR
jgi:hypothetical protein